MTSKTLKDLVIRIPLAGIQTRVIGFEELKQLAIKWVKEDKKVLKIIHPTQYKILDGYLKLWMKRLDITEEDLK